VRRLLLAALRSIPNVWMSAGIALAFVALLEGAYVGQRALRSAWLGSDDEREAQAEGHPYAGEAWYRDFLRARAAVREKYDPWRSYWAYPMATTYLTVDAEGRRATPQPVAIDGAPRTIFLLGGSAMWGYTARDTATIAAKLASRLPAAGLRDAALVNLSQPGYTVGHELAALQYELGRGRVPALAIFYDGINDIRTAHLYGEPGHAFFEARFGKTFEVDGTRGFFGSFITPAERSQLAARLGLALGLNTAWQIKPHDPAVCPALGRYYADTATSAAGLGAARGFGVLFVQQPHHASTGKRPTPFEATFMEPDEETAWTRECSAAIDAAMARATAPYVSHGALFDDVADTVFLDRFGHVTEAAHDRIADSLAAEIAKRLATPPGPEGATVPASGGRD
jgi:lysophospholipase L1-like esterase